MALMSFGSTYYARLLEIIGGWRSEVYTYVGHLRHMLGIPDLRGPVSIVYILGDNRIR